MGSKFTIKNKINFLKATAFSITTLVAVLMIQPCIAEEKSMSTISIAHNYPFDHQDLPQAGLPFELRAYAVNTKDASKRMRLLVVKDGIFSEIYPKKQFLNDDKVPEYVFTVYAPSAGMKYSFIIDDVAENGAESLSISDEFNVVRACVSDTNDELKKEVSTLEGNEKLSFLVSKARKLETEIDLYAEAKNLISQINEEISKIKEEKS